MFLDSFDFCVQECDAYVTLCWWFHYQAAQFITFKSNQHEQVKGKF